MIFSIPSDMEQYLDSALHLIAENVRITEKQEQECEQKFNAITSLLDGSEIAKFRPVLRLQGSMRLGTAIRNITNSEKYDVDIVVELLNLPMNYTPCDLKNAIGNVLKNSDRYKGMIVPPDGGKRCWTLEYADGTHIDLLPAAISNNYIRSIALGFNENFNDFELRITDKTRYPEYYIETDRSKWLVSNPIGFAEWFFTQARTHEEKRMMNECKSFQAAIEPFPQRTEKMLTLQEIICLLKRHRDKMFDHDKEKPISMIITVLAAKAYAYAKSGNLFITMRNIANQMINMMDTVNGKRVVLNPVNPKEDFTDRWRREDGGQRETKFYRWVQRLSDDLTSLTECRRVDIGRKLKEMFGHDQIMLTALEQLGRKGLEENKSLKMLSSGVFAAAGTITAKANTFYGK